MAWQTSGEGVERTGTATAPCAARPSVSVQLRYRSPAVAVAGLVVLGRGRLGVKLAAPFEAPAAGQAAVFYDGLLVRAAGTLALPDGPLARTAV
jgi:tRNA U34 2-thiouridine synthase MnmA/TrmU